MGRIGVVQVTKYVRTIHANVLMKDRLNVETLAVMDHATLKTRTNVVMKNIHVVMNAVRTEKLALMERVALVEKFAGPEKMHSVVGKNKAV